MKDGSILIILIIHIKKIGQFNSVSYESLKQQAVQLLDEFGPILSLDYFVRS